MQAAIFGRDEKGLDTYLNAAPVIRDLQELQTAILDKDFYVCRASINGIFHHLFQSIDWGYDYLACSDPVYDRLGEGLVRASAQLPCPTPLIERRWVGTLMYGNMNCGMV